MSYEITKADLQEIGERVKEIQKLPALTDSVRHIRNSIR